jgi:tetratricopeptide (TPR) repeat protein
MIVTTDTREARQAEQDAQFNVAPPRFSPLAANGPLSFTKNEDTFDIHCGPVVEEYAGCVSQISARLIERSRRDVEKRPGSAKAHTNLGIALLNAGNVTHATEEFERALSINPKQYVAGTSLAKIKVDMGDFDIAANIYRDLQCHYPLNSTLVLSLAQIAIRKEEYEQAVQLLREAIRFGHKAVTAKYYLAMVLLKLGNNREAIVQLRSALQSEVRAPFLYEGLGIAYNLSGDQRRALVAFKTALALAPDSQSAILNVAQMELDLKEVGSAKELLREYLDRSPNDLTVKEMLGRAYHEAKQYRSAIAQKLQLLAELDRRGIEDRSRRARIANNLGASYIGDGQLNEAEKWLQNSISTDADAGPLAYDNLGRLYLQQNNVSKAIAILRESRRRFPKNEDSAILLAALLVDESMYDEAIVVLRRVIDTGKATDLSYGLLACILADEKADYDGALAVMLESYSQWGSEPMCVNHLAYVYLVRGEPIRARQVLEKHRNLLKHDSKAPLATRAVLTATWGLLHIAEGNLGVGEEMYRKAQTLASEAGDQVLAAAAIQKMHLELARALLKIGEVSAARTHLKAGLNVRNGVREYERRLQKMSTETASGISQS